MDTLFSQRVVVLALSIPPGRVSTYGIIAQKALGGTMASRSITHILGKAAHKGIKHIPFHRIVYSNGKVWCHEPYDTERKKLYKKEKIEIDEKGYIKNFRDVLYEFDDVSFE